MTDEAGRCPHCRQPGRRVNLLHDLEPGRRASDLNAGAYAVCDEHAVFWLCSSQFWDDVPRDEATWTIRARYRLVTAAR
jgi:hypothetical protein